MDGPKKLKSFLDGPAMGGQRMFMSCDAIPKEWTKLNPI